MYQQMTIMKSIDNSSNVYENESLEQQIIRLIKSYYIKFKIYDKYFNDTNIDRDLVFDEFVENAVYFILTRKCIDNYDDSVATFSTYIFSVIKHSEIIFINQIKYNFSLNESIRYSRMTEEEKYNYLTNFHYSIELDAKVCKKDDKEVDLTIGDIIADSHDVYEEFIDSENYNYKLNQILNYIKRSKKLTKKDKERLYYHINNGYNTKDTTRHFGISRQRLNQITKRLKKLLIDAGIRYDN